MKIYYDTFAAISIALVIWLNVTPLNDNVVYKTWIASYYTALLQ